MKKWVHMKDDAKAHWPLTMGDNLAVIDVLFRGKRIYNYSATGKGVSTTMDAMSLAASSYQKTGRVDDNYNHGIK